MRKNGRKKAKEANRNLNPQRKYNPMYMVSKMEKKYATRKYIMLATW